MSYDAIIVGSGHNGLVTAIYLAKAGWKVLVLERNAVAGGAVQTAEVTLPGFRHDLYATNLNLFAGSPFYQEFKAELDAQGLEFVPVTHTFSSVFPDGSAIAIPNDLPQALASLRAVNVDDAKSWERMASEFPASAQHIFPLLGEAMPSWGLAKALYRGVRAEGYSWLLDTARLLVSSPRDFGDSHFQDERVKSLIAAWAMHLNFSPDMAGGALFSYLESMANQCFGMVVGKNGASNLVDALVGLLKSLGGEIRLGAEVNKIETSGGVATGVILADGEQLNARKAVVANITPARLFGDLVAADQLPPSFMRKVSEFKYGPATLMVHLALSELPTWTADPGLARFAYVHIGPYLADLNKVYNEAASGLLPQSPLLVVGQPTAVDPSRAPNGQHILWVQVRVVPTEIKGDAAGEITGTDWASAKDQYADRVLNKIAAYAPDVHDKVLARAVFSPADLEQANPNLVGGDSLSGAHSLRQNFLFRPFPGWSKYKTPIKSLYMVGASTWPGAGVGAGSGRLLGKMLT